MGYILLGHGTLDLDPSVTSPEMEIVAIPQNTTIQFYTDAGQVLWYGARELDLWSRLHAPWAPLDSNSVTYNLALHSDVDSWTQDLRNSLEFDGHTLIRAGVDGFPDPLVLCTGTREICPTGVDQVAAGARHGCDGVLGREDLEGDLYWLACTSIEGADQSVVDAALDGRPTDVRLGHDPDWAPGEADHEAMARVNRANVERAYPQQDMFFRTAGSSLLLGLGHDPRYVEYARIQDGLFRGGLTVYKEGSEHSQGRFDIYQYLPGSQDLIRSALGRFSDYEVRFR